MIKVDGNLSQNNRGYFRYTNTHRRDLNVGGTSPGAAAPLETLETRQTFGGPLWNVLGNWTTTLSNRAFNELRVTYGVNKPWILEQHRRRPGGSDLLAAAGYNTSAGNPTGKFARISYPGRELRRHVVHRARRREQPVPDRQLLARVRPAPVQVRRHRRAAADVHGRRSGAQRLVDLHAGQGVRPRTIRRRSRPASAATSGRGKANAGGLESVAVHPGHVAGWPQPDAEPRGALRPRPDADDGQPVHRLPTTSGSSRGCGGAPPLAKSVADKNNISPRLGVVWVPTADRTTTLRGSFGFYYDQNHWNLTDIYVNETLLAMRRVSLNANTQANNPFWTPANTAIGIAQMRAFLATNFPAYPDLSGLPFPRETILGVQPDYKIPYSKNFAVGMTNDFGAAERPRSTTSTRGPTTPASAPTPTGCRTPDGTFTRARSALREHHARRQRRVDLVRRPRDAHRVPSAGERPRRAVVHAVEDALEHVDRPQHRRHHQPVRSRTRISVPDDNDRRHNFVLDGSYLVPKIDVQLAGITTYRSAVPYSVSTSVQLDPDPFTDRPEPRNSRRGSTEKSTDLRVSKIFRLGRPRHRDRVLGDVQRLQRRQLAALSGQPAVGAVRPAAHRGAEAAPAARVQVRFLSGDTACTATASALASLRQRPAGLKSCAASAVVRRNDVEAHGIDTVWPSCRCRCRC